LDIVWIENRRFFHCWLCDDWYDIVDGKIEKIVPEHVMSEYRKLLSEYGEKLSTEKSE